MKKILFVLVACFALTGCGGSAIDSLQGDDLTAYKMMLEVCYNASDPSEVTVISGSVTSETGVFKVSYGGEETYNVLVSSKDGDYVAEKLHDQLVTQYKDLLYETNDFSASKVNKALKEKWNN